MNYKEFFTTDNKSGWKTKESTLKVNKPEIYSELLSFIKQHDLLDLPFKQQIWHFINNEIDKKKCLNCGQPVEFRGTLVKGYHKFCSLPCANESGLLDELAKKRTLEKHGVSYYTEHKDFISKVKKTKLIKYKDENYNNKEKALATKETLYGNKNFNNKGKSKLTLRKNLLDRLKSVTNDSLIKYDIEDSNISLRCVSCDGIYEIYNTLFNYRTNYNIKLCTICNPINSTDSYHEDELYQFIKELLPNNIILREDRQLISPFEIDILLPELKIGIEFNGLYWHSNKHVNNNYHLNKTKNCRLKDFDLIHIFEDEWIYKKEIVKSIIKSKLGLNNNVIYARKCIIKEVDYKLSKSFLTENHIQGCTNSKYNIGLFYNDELMSLMTFGPLRKALGSTAVDGNFELLRFVNKLNTTITGGFSKLLKYFISNYQPKSILTFSDNRYFNGEVYNKNGFKYIGETKPNYWYIVAHKREYRFKYRKDVLVKDGYDISKSESQIMSDRGINKIYDCGNKKWLLTLIG